MSTTIDETRPDYDYEMLIKRVQSGVSAFELVYRPTPSWPRSSPHAPLPSALCILDSSFNPPTRAHLALASAAEEANQPRLLLLSVRNVDKTLAPGDATYLQRLAMMRLIAEDAHAALGLVDTPTFVGKAQVLEKAYAQFSGDASARSPRLAFLLGLDTLERLLAPRYYESPEAMRAALAHFFHPDGQNASVVCAHRIMSGEIAVDEEKERQLMDMAGEVAAPGRISFVDIGADLARYSSSEVRKRIKEGRSDWRSLVTDRVAKYVEDQGLYRT